MRTGFGVSGVGAKLTEPAGVGGPCPISESIHSLALNRAARSTSGYAIWPSGRPESRVSEAILPADAQRGKDRRSNLDEYSKMHEHRAIPVVDEGAVAVRADALRLIGAISPHRKIGPP